MVRNLFHAQPNGLNVRMKSCISGLKRYASFLDENYYSHFRKSTTELCPCTQFYLFLSRKIFPHILEKAFALIQTPSRNGVSVTLFWSL